jgi:DNA repair protein RadC
LVSPSDVFREAIREGAVSLVVVHNHPSGDPTPSAEDVLVTDRLVAAGKLLDVPLLDHIIIGERRFVSLRERGIIT